MEDRGVINRFIKIIGIICIAAVMFAFLIDDYHDVPEYTYVYLGSGSRDMTKELSKGVLITQEVPYYKGDMGLSFIFSTFGHRVFGDVTVKAVGMQSGSVYFDRTIPGKEIKSNQYIDFFFPKDITASDGILTVSFSSDCEPGSGLAVMTTGIDSIPDNTLTVDGETAETDLMVRRVVTYSFPRIILWIALVIGFAAAAILIWRKPPLEWVYVVLAVSLGILYMFILTPLAIPDEQVHYQSAYYLSGRILFREPGVGEAQHFDYTNLSGHYNTEAGYTRVVTEFLKTSDPETKRKIKQYELPYPLMYLPQAAGISLGRLFRLNFMMTFYLGRLFNLLFFVACVHFAIRKAPGFKLLIFMFGLMPMALHQAASYSYDTFINGLSILFIALILKLRVGEGRIRFAEILPALLTGILVCPAKPVYAPMMLLFLLIPVRRFGSFRKFIIIFVGILFLAGGAVLVSRMGSISDLLSIPDHSAAGIEDDSAEKAESSEKLYDSSFILSHPKQTFRIFLDTARSGERWFGWLQESVGSRMAGFTMLIDEWHIFAYITILLISSFVYQGQRFLLRAADRVLLLFVSACVIGAVMLVMFVGWTSYGASGIYGIQGRYFIPILPLVFICFNNRMITIRRPVEKIVIFIGSFINLSILNQIILLTMNP